MGLATAYGPFLPALYRPFVLREAGRAPQKGLPEHGLSKGPKVPAWRTHDVKSLLMNQPAYTYERQKPIEMS